MILTCPKCGYKTTHYHYKCPLCGSPMELTGPIERRRILGEGETPLVEDEYKGHKVYFKLDYLNPTGSFKDRGTAASIFYAVRRGYRCVVEDSSGNTGISVAAYASHMGLESVIVVPRKAAAGKKTLISRLGARLIEEDTREDAARRAEELAAECFYIAHAWSPIFIEGTSTIAGELPKDLRDSPIFIPVSSGTLLLGLYRGLTSLGVKPRLYAVQSPQAASLAGLVEPTAVLGSSGDMLDALVYRNPPRLNEMVEAIAGGGLYVVGWEYARRAYDWLYKRGYIVEPSSAVAFAAFMHAADNGIVDEGVVVLTGSGLKYMGLDIRGRG